MSEEICEVVITAADETWLAEFVRQLVNDRLAACGQIIPRIRSIYRWDDEVQDEREARVALHTRLHLVPIIIERTNRDHAYEVPCVLALRVLNGNPDYIKWVLDETLGASSGIEQHDAMS